MSATHNDILDRVQRLRADYPAATVTTSHVVLTRSVAVMWASVTGKGGASATAYGSSEAEFDPEYVEVAEARATLRALERLGYAARVEDTPIAASVDPEPVEAQDDPIRPPVEAASSAQVKLIEAIRREAGIDDDTYRDEWLPLYDAGSTEDLDRLQASDMIDRLRQWQRNRS